MDNLVEYEESDDEIFTGPVTKREIMHNLKYYNLLTEELLEPLKAYKDHEPLEDKLVSYYDDLIFGKSDISKLLEDTVPKNVSIIESDSNLDCSTSKNLSTKDTVHNLNESSNNAPQEENINNFDEYAAENISQNVSVTESEPPSSIDTLNDNEPQILSKSLKEDNVSESSYPIDIIDNDGPSIHSESIKEDSLSEPSFSIDTLDKNESHILSESTQEDSYQVPPVSLEESCEVKLLDETENILQNLNAVEKSLASEDSRDTLDVSKRDPPEYVGSNETENFASVDTSFTSETSDKNFIEEKLLASLTLNDKNIKCEQIEPKLLDSLILNDSISNNEAIDCVSISSDSFDMTNTSDIRSYSHLDANSTLNDTLEEMEMLMRFGENYMIEQKGDNSFNSVSSSAASESKDSNVSNTDDNVLIEQNSKSHSISSNGSTATTSEINSYTPNKFKNSNSSIESNITPVLKSKNNYASPRIIQKTPKSHDKFRTGDYSHKPRTPCIGQLNHVDPHFKVPTKIPSAKKSPNLKHIVSPISLYIKNSPKVPLVKHVVLKQIHAHTAHEPKNLSTEKSQEKVVAGKSVLPVRSYKPAARNIFMSKENEPALPGNIRKLIKGPLNPEIIKHVARVKASPDKFAMPMSPNPISANDMTMLSTSTASEGVFNVSTGPPGDVSVYVSKNAARTKFLQKPST